MNLWTIGGLFTAALALAVILGWIWGRRQPAVGQPLGLPEGTVRAMLALVVCLPVVIMAANQMKVPEFLTSAFTLILGLYFGARAQQAATDAAQRMRTPRDTSGAGGYAMPWTLGTIALACIVVAAAILLSGCTTGTMKSVQGGVNFAARKVGGQKAVDAIESFRDAEVRVYADENGLISTQGLSKVTQLYAVDEKRWINGRVIPRERFIRDLAPIGDAPEIPAYSPQLPSTLTLATNSPAAERPPAITPAPPVDVPAAGGSLTGPATGGIVQ